MVRGVSEEQKKGDKEASNYTGATRRGSASFGQAEKEGELGEAYLTTSTAMTAGGGARTGSNFLGFDKGFLGGGERKIQNDGNKGKQNEGNEEMCAKISPKSEKCERVAPENDPQKAGPKIKINPNSEPIIYPS